MVIKIFNSIKSKIIPYGFSLFSMVFLGYMLVKVFEQLYYEICTLIN